MPCQPYALLVKDVSSRTRFRLGKVLDVMYNDGIGGWYGFVGLLIAVSVIGGLLSTIGYFMLQLMLQDDYKS